MTLSMKTLRYAVVPLIIAFNVDAAAPHRCASEAQAQAKKLVAFHLGQADDRIEVDPKVAVLRPVKNPVGKDSFDVLEVTVNVYKATYRTHFLYAQKVKDECLLMGQEVLELATP